MNDTPENWPYPYIPTITPDTGIGCPKNDAEMTYLKNKNIREAIHQKLRKKYVYETNMNKTYNIIVIHPNKKLQEKAALYTTFQAVKKCQYNIGYLITLKKFCFLKQSKQHPIQSLCMVTRQV